jgi:hypothetical protein
VATRVTARTPRLSSGFVLDPQLRALAYRCHPDGCPRGRTCCVGLVVEVSRREVRAIDTLMDELARLVPALRQGRGFANVFVDDPPGLVIESGDDGACPFLFRTRAHALCAVHHVAAETGRRVAAYKPAACRHWPLLLEADGARVRVTVQPAALRMGCVAPVAELPGQPTVLEAFRTEITELCAAVRETRHSRERRTERERGRRRRGGSPASARHGRARPPRRRA